MYTHYKQRLTLTCSHILIFKKQNIHRNFIIFDFVILFKYSQKKYLKHINI